MTWRIRITGTSLMTIFFLSALDWTDSPEDLPLTYTFSHPNGFVLEPSFSPSQSGYLPIGDPSRSNAVNLSLAVKDQYGAIAFASTCGSSSQCAVIVSPPDSSGSAALLAQVQSLTSGALRSKVRVLFACLCPQCVHSLWTNFSTSCEEVVCAPRH